MTVISKNDDPRHPFAGFNHIFSNYVRFLKLIGSINEDQC